MELERNILIERLKRELVGPKDEQEIIEERPDDQYMNGILFPIKTNVPEEEREKGEAEGRTKLH